MLKTAAAIAQDVLIKLSTPVTDEALRRAMAGLPNPKITPEDIQAYVAAAHDETMRRAPGPVTGALLGGGTGAAAGAILARPSRAYRGGALGAVIGAAMGGLLGYAGQKATANAAGSAAQELATIAQQGHVPYHDNLTYLSPTDLATQYATGVFKPTELSPEALARIGAFEQAQKDARMGHALRRGASTGLLTTGLLYPNTSEHSTLSGPAAAIGAGLAVGGVSALNASGTVDANTRAAVRAYKDLYSRGYGHIADRVLEEYADAEY